MLLLRACPSRRPHRARQRQPTKPDNHDTTACACASGASARFPEFVASTSWTASPQGRRRRAPSVVTPAANTPAPTRWKGACCITATARSTCITLGVKFAVQLASTGDQVIDAIPGASEAQWDSLFMQTPAAPNQPEPLPPYCYSCFS